MTTTLPIPELPAGQARSGGTGFVVDEAQPQPAAGDSAKALEAAQASSAESGCAAVVCGP